MRINSIELKGKPLSLGAKLIGCFIAAGALVLKATVSPGLDIDAAIKAAAFVVIVFAPVDLSMISGNIFGTRAARPAGTGYAAGGGK
jgi:predicted phage tail protein